MNLLSLVLLLVVVGIAQSEGSFQRPKSWPITFPPDFEEDFLAFMFKTGALQFPKWLRNNTIDPTPPAEHAEKVTSTDTLYLKWTTSPEQMYGYNTNSKDFNVTTSVVDLTTYSVTVVLNHTGEVILRGKYKAEGFAYEVGGPRFSGSGDYSVKYTGSFRDTIIFTYAIVDNRFVLGDRPAYFSSSLNFDAEDTDFEGLWDDLDPSWEQEVRKTLAIEISNRYSSYYKGHPVADLLIQCVQGFLDDPYFLP